MKQMRIQKIVKHEIEFVHVNLINFSVDAYWIENGLIKCNIIPIWEVKNAEKDAKKVNAEHGYTDLTDFKKKNMEAYQNTMSGIARCLKENQRKI